MAVLDTTTNEIVIRVVYDGPPEAGKTTSMRALATSFSQLSVTPEENSTGRTQWFDWMEYVGGRFEGSQIRCQIVSVPGQRELGRRREVLLASADVIVFVGDTSRARWDVSLEYLSELHRLRNTEEAPVGIIFQANKRDVVDAVSLAEIRANLGDMRWETSLVESVAADGTGIREAFVYAVRLALDRVRELVGAGKLREGRPQQLSPADLLAQLREAEARMSAEPPAIPPAASIEASLLDAAASSARQIDVAAALDEAWEALGEATDTVIQDVPPTIETNPNSVAATLLQEVLASEEAAAQSAPSPELLAAESREAEERRALEIVEAAAAPIDLTDAVELEPDVEPDVDPDLDPALASSRAITVELAPVAPPPAATAPATGSAVPVPVPVPVPAAATPASGPIAVPVAVATTPASGPVPVAVTTPASGPVTALPPIPVPPRDKISLASSPRPPDASVPSGAIWPPVEGRAILMEVSQIELVPRRHANGDWSAGLGSGWRLVSKRDAMFDSLDVGRNALVSWARLHAACMSIVSPHRCIVLAATGDGRWRLWQIVRAEESLRDIVERASTDSEPEAVVESLCQTAHLLVDVNARLAEAPCDLPVSLDTIGACEESGMYIGLMPESPEPSRPRPTPSTLLEAELGPMLSLDLAELRADLGRALGSRSVPAALHADVVLSSLRRLLEQQD